MSSKQPPSPIFDLQRVLREQRDNDDYRTASLSSNFTKTAPRFAITDYKLSVQYLLSLTSADTFNSYRRDMERLHLWSWIVKQTSVLKLKPDDINQYMDFLEQPPEKWIGVVGTNNGARFKSVGGIRKPNTLWRPFVLTDQSDDFSDYRFSDAAIKGTVRTLSAFYNHLCEEDLIAKTPIRKQNLKTRMEKNPSKRIILRISVAQWQYVLKTAEKLADNNPDEHERTLFIVNALYAMYLRISELTSRINPRTKQYDWVPRMNSFKEEETGWWFHCKGKGDKPREVVVSTQMLKALKRYRKHRGMTGLPGYNDNAVLIPNYRRKNLNDSTNADDAISSTRTIRKIMAQVFDQAYEDMKLDLGEDKAGALQAATVHWLRHTSISEAVKVRDLNQVSKEVGHTDIKTTAGYVDADKIEHQKSGKHIKY